MAPMNQSAKPCSPTARSGNGRGRFWGWLYKGHQNPRNPVQAKPPTAKTGQVSAAVHKQTPTGELPGKVTEPVFPVPRVGEAVTAVAEPTQDRTEIVELVHSLRNHIDQQSDRSERLLEKMDGLPEALRSLPEASQTNHRMLQSMQDHLQQQQTHSQRLIQVIEGMVVASKHRDETIDMLQHQIIASQEKDSQLMSGFTTLGQTMSKISDIQETSASVLHRIADTANQAEVRMRSALEINKRQALTWSVSGWAMAIALLAMTGFVAVAATRIAKMPRAATDPVPDVVQMALPPMLASPVAEPANDEKVTDEDEASADAASTRLSPGTAAAAGIVQTVMPRMFAGSVAEIADAGKVTEVDEALADPAVIALTPDSQSPPDSSPQSPNPELFVESIVELSAVPTGDRVLGSDQ